MALDNFDKLTSEIGLKGISQSSFTHALGEAARTNGRVYATIEGFQANLADKAVKIPLETIRELARAIGQEAETEALSLNHHVFKRLWLWVTGQPRAIEQHQRIYQAVQTVLYPEFNRWAVRDEEGTPEFLRLVRAGNLHEVRKAVDELVKNPNPNFSAVDLFFDREGKGPLHALALNPHLENRMIGFYMQEFKQLDPECEKLWVKKDQEGNSPLSLAASELNSNILDYVVKQLTGEEVAQDHLVLELLKYGLKPRFDEISQRLKESNRANNPFQAKQLIRRMLITAAQHYPGLFESVQIEGLPKEMLSICQMANQLGQAEKGRQEGFKAWREECKAFETSLQNERSAKPEELLKKVYQRIEDIRTLLSERQNIIKGLSKRDNEGMTEVQRKAVEGDLAFFKKLCNPLNTYDHYVDFSDQELMKTAKGVHLLEILVKSQHSLEIIKLLLSKAPELVEQADIERLCALAPESQREELREILNNPYHLAVEKDQLLQTESYRRQIFGLHLDYLNSIVPELRGDVQLPGDAARLKNSPKVARIGRKLAQPKAKSKIELIGMVFKSLKLIGTIISSIAIKIKATLIGLVNSQTAERVEAAALRTVAAIPSAIAGHESMFGDRLISSSRNIGSYNVVEREEDQQAAEKLYQEFSLANKTNHKQMGVDKLKQGEMGWGLLYSDPKDWKGVVRSGVCWGTSIDFIQRYQEQGFEKIEDIAKLYTEGVPASACANQAVYLALNIKPDHPFDLILSHLELLGRLDGMDATFKQGLFNADFGAIQAIFAMMINKEIVGEGDNNLVRKSYSERSKLIEMTKKFKSDHPLVGMISERLKNKLMDSTGKNSVAQFFEAIGDDWATYMNEKNLTPSQSVKGINILTWLEGLFMQQVGYRKELNKELVGLSSQERERQAADGKTIDPRFAEIPNQKLKDFLAKVDATRQLDRIESPVIKMRGLEQETVQGLPERGVVPTDVDYLRQFDHLEDGAYVISFSTQSFQANGAHAINYFKKGEQGFFFDPNPGLIKCEPNNHAKDLLKLLTLYPMPTNSTSHGIQILKVSQERK